MGIHWWNTDRLVTDLVHVYKLAALSFVGALTVCYYWRLAHHLARIAKPQRSNHLVQPTGKERPAAD